MTRDEKGRIRLHVPSIRCQGFEFINDLLIYSITGYWAAPLYEAAISCVEGEQHWVKETCPLTPRGVPGNGGSRLCAHRCTRSHHTVTCAREESRAEQGEGKWKEVCDFPYFITARVVQGSHGKNLSLGDIWAETSMTIGRWLGE